MIPLEEALNHHSKAYAVMSILELIRDQPELRSQWVSMANAERNYFIGKLYNILDEVRE